ncbi:hypothetical protein PBCVNEJV1_649R [Paramecium bursaria Chlorella virus NE-JV-1]|nr:hypothetical protein PBCVNEJV1_649R [Paramecium bursaria Chlorella virus NE-JV-1]
MKILKDVNDTIDSISHEVKPHGHKKIGRIMIFFWSLHVVATVLLTVFLFRHPDDNVIIGTFLIILQLMIGKIFESANKMYDNCMRVQSNVADIKSNMIDIFREYKDLADKHVELQPDIVSSIEILNDRILEDLRVYSRNMCAFNIVINSFLWKSPEYTPFLEKDAIRDKFATSIKRIKQKIKNSESYLRNLRDASLDYIAI